MAEVMNMPVDVVERRSSRERKDDDGNGNGNDNDNGNANANANADGEDNNKSTGNENPDASSPPPPPPPPSRRHDRDSRERSNDDRDRDVDRPPNRRSDYYEHRNRSPPVLPHRDYKRRAASPSSPPPPPYRDRRGGGPPLLPGGHLHFLRLSGLVGMTVVTMVAVEVLAEVLDLVIEGCAYFGILWHCYASLTSFPHMDNL